MNTVYQPLNQSKVHRGRLFRRVKRWPAKFNKKLPTEYSPKKALKIYLRRLVIFLAMAGLGFVFLATVGFDPRIRFASALALVLGVLALWLWVLTCRRMLRAKDIELRKLKRQRDRLNHRNAILRAQRLVQVEEIYEPRGALAPEEEEQPVKVALGR
jgi:hypothetical protein